ncbi:MAG: LysM peptidoglycan-binding domain-containing protein [Chloroflexi bacterium]|nr:LysM peptidoglycan-binding domain-containing protein [Chloroflexota bacterium]
MNAKRIFAMLMLMMAVMLPAWSALAQTSTQGAVCARTHTVQRGETLSRIARTYNTTVAALQTLNNISNVNRINAGQVLCVQEAAQGTTYVVARGDTLSSIARRFGVDMTVLAQINGITNPNRIFVGQTLIIPDVTIQLGS